MAQRILFVESLPLDASTRDRELQLSATRAHSAFVAHSRRKPRSYSRLPLQPGRSIALRKFVDSKGPADLPQSDDGWEDVEDDTSSEAGHCCEEPKQQSQTHQGQTRQRQTEPLRRSFSALLSPPHRIHSKRPRSPASPQLNANTTKAPTDRQRPGSQLLEQIPDNFRTIKDKAEVQNVHKIYRGLSPLARNINQVEPFYCNPGGNVSSFYRGCEYFLQVIIPNNAPVYTIFNVSNVFTQYTFDLTQKDHFLHVFLGTMHLIRSATAPETSSSQDAWRHCGVALSRLRHALTDRKHLIDDDHVIGSVLFLTLLARAYGDSAGFEVHKENLTLLVRNRGGLGQLGYEGLLEACILQWESFWEIDSARSAFAEERNTKAPEFPKPPLSPGLRNKISSLPSGFETLANKGCIPLDLLEILSRVNNHSNRSARKKLSLDTNPAWHVNKHVDFWDACSSLAISGPDFSKFLCLTLLLYTANEFSPIRQGVKGMTLYANPRTLLTKQIHLLQPLISDHGERLCWMWMWMVLIGSWSERGSLTPAGHNLLLHFHYQFPEIRTWSQLDAIMAKFFYAEKFKASCSDHWDSIPVTSIPTLNSNE